MGEKDSRGKKRDLPRTCALLLNIELENSAKVNRHPPAAEGAQGR